jgi:hypothetical protein
MRHRRPGSLSEASVTVKRVRISRSIWCRTLPPNRGRERMARRGERGVLLTALALQIIHRIDRDEIPVDEVLDNPWQSRHGVDYAGTPVCVRALASSHANTSVRL